MKIVFDFSTIVILSQKFDEQNFKTLLSIFKQFKINPARILFSKIQIFDYFQSIRKCIPLSNKKSNLISPIKSDSSKNVIPLENKEEIKTDQQIIWPHLIYDKKDSFPLNKYNNQIEALSNYNKKDKGRVFILSLVEFSENVKANPECRQMMVDFGIDQIILLSNALFKSEGNAKISF